MFKKFVKMLQLVKKCLRSIWMAPKQTESMMENTTDSDGELQVKKKPKKTIIKSHLVQSLNDKAEAELNLSYNFEQKLLATLHNF